MPQPESNSESARPLRARHVIVYGEPGRFAGWPANHGLWQWGAELVVAFTRGYWLPDPEHHAIDKNRPSELVQARSQDGGETWTLEMPAGPAAGAEPRAPRPGELDFSRPGFALRCDQDRFVVSADRGQSWQGPYALPNVGQPLTGRTDYLVLGPAHLLLFLSANEPRVLSQHQDRALCVQTTDGGRSFELLGWITGEPYTHRSVMPATVRTAAGELVTALRRRVDDGPPATPQRNWIDVYASADQGRTWAFRSKVADTANGRHNGNPPSHVRLADGRLCVAYGSRAEPYGIRARLSADDGRTWGPEIQLRSDAASWDIGYTRMAQRPDGRLITLYYYTTAAQPAQHIAATIWDPGPAGA